MPSIELDRERSVLRVTFSAFERLMMLRRRPLEVPFAAVTTVSAEPGWTSQVLGIRKGLVVSGYLKLATFRHPDGTRRLVTMRRGRPLLRIRLSQQIYDELLLSTPEAPALATALDRARGVSS